MWIKGEEKMKLIMKYEGHQTEVNINSLNEVSELMIAFAVTHQLKDDEWPEFEIKGEFNIKHSVNFNQRSLGALFG